jgi:hypothetical protein
MSMKKHPSPGRSGLVLSLSAVIALAATVSLGACDDRGSAATGLPAPTSDAGATKVDTGSGGSTAVTPAMKCRNLLLAFCAKYTACGDPPVTDDECIAQFTMTDCSMVVGVSPTYDACLMDVPNAPCPLTAPASCKFVLLN